MKKEMLINVLQPEECRIAIVEDGVLEELYVERTSHESYVGNIYKGRIVNIEPSIQAAFVDFGVGRNGFLHVSDVEPAYYRHLEQRRGERGERGERGDRGDRGGRGDRADRGDRGDRGDRRGGRRGQPQRRPARPLDLDEELDTAVPSAAEIAALPDETYPVTRAPEEAELAERVELGALPPETEEPAAETEGEPQAAGEPDVVSEPEPEATKGRRRPRGRSRRTRSEAAAEPSASREGEAPAEPAARESTPASQAPTEPSATEQPPAPSASAEKEPVKGAAKETSGPERPRPMESAERRTDEDEPTREPLSARPDFSDDDLSFSKAREQPAPATVTAEPAPPPEPEPVPEPEPPPEPIAAAPAPMSLDEWADDLEEEDPRAEIEEAPAAEQREHLNLDEDFQGEVPDERLTAFEEEDAYGEPRRRSRRDDRGGDRRGGDRGGPRRQRRGPGRPGAGRPKPLIQDIFRRGQEVLVQVIKEGIGTKGPTLSTYISIAGRYLVLMPGLNRIGVSRKIVDEEQRRRLREILNELEPPKGLGFIIRTAGLDRTKKELQRDLNYLSRLWQVVVRRIRKIKSPAEIYQESDMITRTIRDTFTSEIDTIWIDEPTAFEHAQEFMQIVMPRYANRIKLWENPEPMFHKYGIEEEIARIQMRHVPLPNGGSVVIDQTEALVAIDVNSGNFRAERNDAEETAYQMNLLAAKEIARQLRLRDLGGVIVNDFIDMRDEKHRRGVEKAMRDAVKRDRARTKILKISQFGIIEMTRQRIRPSLKRSVYQDCPACRSTGQVKTVESMSIDVMRMLQLAAHRSGVQRIQIRVQEEVANYLQNRKRKEITRLEEAGGIQVSVLGVASVSPEFLEFASYDSNNNEVRFTPYEETRPRRR
ncbi:MAG TPA: Rne/Rng family ribonuclease [Gemmataceae bacterium]|nr:Rne/Rng family ribonuclease [Gemmataceae bacterium]